MDTPLESQITSIAHSLLALDKAAPLTGYCAAEMAMLDVIAAAPATSLEDVVIKLIAARHEAEIAEADCDDKIEPGLHRIGAGLGSAIDFLRSQGNLAPIIGEFAGLYLAGEAAEAGSAR